MNKNNSFIFSGLIIKEEEGYSALCLDLDVASEGDTLEEAKQNLMEAVNLYLETSIENNLPFIRPVPKEENPVYKDCVEIVKSFEIKVDLQVHVYA
jgi:predicted RNase H-like HicB family nuclease